MRSDKDLLGFCQAVDVSELGRQVVWIGKRRSEPSKLASEERHGEINGRIEVEKDCLAWLELTFVDQTYSESLSVELELTEADRSSSATFSQHFLLIIEVNCSEKIFKDACRCFGAVSDV